MMLKIIETPRDAMQGIKAFIPTQQKIKFINSLLKVGFYMVDIGSFVSPKAIPQMADIKEVIKGLDFENTSSKIMTTIANVRGAKMAMEYDQIHKIAFPYSVSPRFLQLNINTSPTEALKTIDVLQNLCDKHNKELVLYNSMAFGNAYGDPWNMDIMVENTRQLVRMGVKNNILSDTINVGSPEVIGEVYKVLIDEFPTMEFGSHFHATDDDWESKIEAAWLDGVRWFDGVINGRGGCPMSKHKMVGNIATKNLLDFFHKHDQDLNINQKAFDEALLQAAFTFPQ